MMFSAKWLKHVRTIVPTILAAAPVVSRGADVTSSWFGGNSSWGIAANWTNTPPVSEFPNNGNGGFTYDAIVNAGTATLDVPITIERLNFGNANIIGTSTLTLNDLLTWNAGAFRGSGLVLATNGITSTTSPGLIDNRMLLLSGGNATFTNVGMTIQNNAVLENASTWNHSGSGNYIGGTVGTFLNSGTFIKNIGTNEFGGFCVMTNTGTVNVESGTLRIVTGGTHTGTFTVATGAMLSAEGTFASTSSVTGGGTLEMRALAPRTFAGTLNLTGPGSVLTRVSGSTITISNSANIVSVGSALIAAGGTIVWNNVQAINVGSISGIGGSLIFNNPSVTADGMGWAAGQVQFDNTGSVSLGTLTLSPASIITGSAPVNVTGAATWTGGQMIGTGTTNFQGPVTLNFSGNPTLGRTFNFAADQTVNAIGGLAAIMSGTINSAGTFAATNLNLGSGGRFNNTGTFIQVAAGSTSITTRLDSSGTLNVLGGNLFLGGADQHSGTFNIAGGGTLTLFGNAKTFSPTTSVTGAGVLAVNISASFQGAYALTGTTIVNTSGTATFTTAAQTGTLTHSSGTISGVGSLLVTDQYDFGGGITSLRLTIADGAVTNIIGAAGKTVSAGTLDLPNLTTTNWTGTGSINITGNGIVLNDATFIAANNSLIDDVGGGTGVFSNSGVFQKVTGGPVGTTTFGPSVVFVSNNGTIQSDSGTIVMGAILRPLASTTLTTSGVGTVVISGVQDWGAGSALRVTGGTTRLSTNLGQNLDPSIELDSGTLQINTTQNLTSFDAGAVGSPGVAVALNDGTVRIVTQSLTVDAVGGAILDLNDNVAIVNYGGTTPFSTLEDYLRSGYNNGSWTGAGINSTQAATNAGFGVGIAEASDIGSPAMYAGQPIDTTTILITYTLYGDTNLDLIVDIGDFARFAANFNLGPDALPARDWDDGDFNYDRTVNISDFALLAANFNRSASIARANVVPEPMQTALVLLVVLSIRRKHAVVRDAHVLRTTTWVAVD